MRNWPHAPFHQISETGTYMVTSGTYQKKHYFIEESNLCFLQDTLLTLANKHKWHMEAWAIFSNHYHFIAQSPCDASTLKKFIAELHSTTARYINKQQTTPGRKIWHQYWDTKITFQSSYLARLKYVMNNPVKHGLVHTATDYRWCSARWYLSTATKAQQQTVMSTKMDKVNVVDEFFSDVPGHVV